MKLNKESVTGITKLAGAHSTLSFMILVDGTEAYQLYHRNIKEVITILDVVEEFLCINTHPKIPSTKHEWLKAKQSIAKEDTRLRKKVRQELAQQYSEEAAKLYDYSLLVSDYMWSTGIGFKNNITTSVANEITVLSKDYGIDKMSIGTFLCNPSPKTSRLLLKSIVEYYDRPTFFLSYSHTDSKFVDALSEIIEGASARVWRDKKSMDIADSISEKLENAISDSDYFCLILSAKSISSPWVQREYRAALQLQIKKGIPRILPILVEDVEIPTFLKDIKYADFSRNFDIGMGELLKLLKKE